ncbi:LVIVD repeat-containing protein [Gordonia sp. NPDC003376]
MLHRRRHRPSGNTGSVSCHPFATLAVATTIATVALAGIVAPASADPDGTPAVGAAKCDAASHPEPGLQGDVPAAQRDSGATRIGYSCNVRRIGEYTGHGGGITSTSVGSCAYMGSLFPGSLVGPAAGVQVIDASNPSRPRRSATLTAPAMLAGTWESLKANRRSELLVGTGVPALFGAGLLSVYDVSDCAAPQLLNPEVGGTASPLPISAHEGGFSPDGRTYWASGLGPGFLSAVDLSEPSRPRVLWQGLTGLSTHGIGVSADGNRLYLASNFGGITVWDVSAVQRRDHHPQVRRLAELTWTDGWATQHSVPVTYGGKEFLFTVDEGGSGGVKLIDVSTPIRPRVVNKLKLAINLRRNADSATASSMGGGVFAYESHYCAADRPANPTALACGWFSSGVRVFDVHDPFHVREIAYYNPPARTGQEGTLSNSPHALLSVAGVPLLSVPAVLQSLASGAFDPAQAGSSRTGRVVGDLSADWCASPPEWRGRQLWATCADNGFQVLELSASAYTPPPDQQSTVGS